MTLDHSYVSNAEMVRRGREADEADARAAYEEQRLRESEDATEAHWQRVFRQQAKEQPAVRYREERQGIDSRMFGP